MLELIQNMVLLSNYVKNLKDKQSSLSAQTSFRVPTDDEKKVLNYLKVLEKDDKLVTITFRNPDEFLHLFVFNTDELKQYLEFLTDRLKGEIPN